MINEENHRLTKIKYNEGEDIIIMFGITGSSSTPPTTVVKGPSQQQHPAAGGGGAGTCTMGIHGLVVKAFCVFAAAFVAISLLSNVAISESNEYTGLAVRGATGLGAGQAAAAVGRSSTSMSTAELPPMMSIEAHWEGAFGSAPTFRLYSKRYESLWHDVSLYPGPGGTGRKKNFIHMVTEIPKGETIKMELQKHLPRNPIARDVDPANKVTPRRFTYGEMFVNYGFLPRTWEDPDVVSSFFGGSMSRGDNDPVDVMEVGLSVLEMGSITPCKVLGYFELIDQGETDYKILCLALSDIDESRINDIADLRQYKPGLVEKIADWLENYKTTDGKPRNVLTSRDPGPAAQAMTVINETYQRWMALCGQDGTPLENLSKSVSGFWLDSPSCRGRRS